MKLKITIVVVITLFCYKFSNSQSGDWRFIRVENTGVAGDYHHVITGDRFGNVWTGGYMPFWSHGSVIRIDDDGVFTTWSDFEGHLPDDRVNAILFDQNDHLWVGTDQGIAYHDGFTWQHFNTANTPALIYDQVIDFAIDNNNHVWATLSEFGSILAGAVATYNGSAWTVYTSSNSNLPTQTLGGIAIDQQNNKWMGSNMGLIKFDGLNWIIHHPQNSGISSSSVGEVMMDSLNRVWAIAGGNTINIYDGTNWSYINSSNSPMGNTSYSNFYVRGDRMMVSQVTNSSLIHVYDGASWNTFTGSNHIYSNYIDEEGNFWLCGIGVVSKYDGSQWTHYSRYNTGLAENFNEDVFIDSHDRKWFANGNGGIQVFDCPKWEAYGPWNGGLFPIPQTFSTVGTSIGEDSFGDIWFTYDGTYGYAVRIPNGDYSNYGAWTVYDQTNSHPNMQGLDDVEADPFGRVFFRGYNELFMFDHTTNTWTTVTPVTGFSFIPKCMTSGPGGKMYFGSYQVIYIHDNSTWTSIDFQSLGLNIDFVWDIEFDATGNMWLATSDGVWKYNGTTWTNWNESNSNIAADNVKAIEIGNADTVFIGAHNTAIWPYYGGISVFDGVSWVSFLEGSSPVPHKQVEDIELDALGNLWVLGQSEGFGIYRNGGVVGFECINRTVEMGGTTSTFEIFEPVDLNITTYPNPFSNNSTIQFYIPDNGMVNITITDLSGRKVKELINQNLEKGTHTLNLNANDFNKGVYLGTITSSNASSSIKIVIK